MADDTPTTAPVDAPVPAAATEVTDTTLAEPGTSEAEVTQENGDAPIGTSEADDEKVAEGDASAVAASANSTPLSGSKDKKRKSLGGVPEHKAKKLNKKKSMPELHLDCKPGEYYWARVKGFPAWPAIVVDVAMLPMEIMAKQPVSAKYPDGSYRQDFQEGGKNYRERTFPIMYLHTNEFQFIHNTMLKPLDPEECKGPPKAKMAKSLQGAYTLAAENHGLEYFRKLQKDREAESARFEKEIAELEEQEARAAEEEAKQAEEDELNGVQAAKPKKKASRKSKAADEDVEMEGVEAPKSSKKRKKDVESDGEEPKTKKTPKVTKLGGPKDPNDEGTASVKKSSSKPKRKVVSAPPPPPEEDDGEPKAPLTEAEKLEQREKSILYLRHRLQKGFLARDQAPQESEMKSMADFFAQLEGFTDLEAGIIRTTKIHKVLKAICKLASVPKDEEFHFKKRSTALLEVWNKRMEADTGAEVKPTAPEVSNGDDHPSVYLEPADKVADAGQAAKQDMDETDVGAEVEKNGEEPEEKTTDADVPMAEPLETAVELGNDAGDEADGDVSMTTASEEVTA